MLPTSAPILLTLHLLGSAVWTGGHLVLALTVLPPAWRRHDPAPLLAFEQAFERIGLPALALQVVTGLLLALALRPAPAEWLDAGDPVARAILLKLALLAATAALGAHARLRLIPRLDAARLPTLGWHIAAVTALSVGFVIAGASLRFGGL